MTKYALGRQDGGVSILNVVTDLDRAIAGWTAANGSPPVSMRPVKDADIPSDRTFRNAWRPDLSCDMAKARDIHRNRMREARAPKLAALDVEYQRADEGGDAQLKKDIASRKQELRDVTKSPDLEAAATPEALKAVWPECLR